MRPFSRYVGSSPLTRGKPACRSTGLGSGGLIPAHAGKTEPRSPPRSIRRAHPRSRGENDGADGVLGENTGSSPLTRGKREGRGFCAPGRGLIPAHAGKTEGSGSRWNPNGAHPRSRGENSMVTMTRAGSMGSSPLTRGKHRLTKGERLISGLIPAHAGKTYGHASACG